MKLRFSSLLAACFFVAACSPSIEEIEALVDAYVFGLGEAGQTTILDIEQTDNNIYSGTYSVEQEDNLLYAYPFTAIIKDKQVSQFFKETDDTKVMVISVKPEAMDKGEEEITEDDLVIEAKKDYDERIRREEEERQAAMRRASGSGLGQKGANYLLSGHNGIIQVISYKQVSKAASTMYQSMFGANIVVYSYKVLEANGYGGTQTAAYDIVFQNGKIIWTCEATFSDTIDYINNAAALTLMLGQ